MRFAVEPPAILLSDGESGELVQGVWERLEPGVYRNGTKLVPGRWYRGAISLGNESLSFGPVLAGGNIEWVFDQERIQELRNVSAVSGGAERINLSSAWAASSPHMARSGQVPLLVLLLVVFLAEALVSRTGW